jgi:tRNA(Ile)-lysidine synthase
LAPFERLDPASQSPVCVAVSGGGDSLAALIHTCAWAARVGRPVLALSVDHGLQPRSAAWIRFAGQAAERLGAGFRALAWTGEKPKSGLPAAARKARHDLLAEAARAAGSRVIVTGHTADDQVENAALGQGILREWSASPVWPEGRGVFLLRPLLQRRRADIRADLLADGWRWIDDPANEDPRSARARVRVLLPSPMRGWQSHMSDAPAKGSRWPSLASSGGGLLAFPRSITARTLALAAVCAGGGSRLPRSAEVDRIIGRLASGQRFVATLCGARIDAADEVAFTRERGRAGLPAFALPAGETVVWDGRYELQSDEQGLVVRPLAGHASKLPPEQKAALRRIDARARAVLPLIQRMDGAVSCPILAGNNAVRVRLLVRERFLSAFGAIETEQQACDVLCMAN